MSPVDLRSDTLTRPTAAMRAAMAQAEVGDDVFGEDPTVRALEELAAARLGKEAALYVPSGTMANQLAIRGFTQPGDAVLLEAEAHPFLYEAGGAAVLSGVQLIPLPGRRGVLSPEQVQGALRAPDDHVPPATLLCLENTTNRGGGAVWPVSVLDAVCDTAHQAGLRVHLDGARLFNAAVALGVGVDRLAQGADSVSVCLSKGLGAPVGSLLAGPAGWIRRARRHRKMLGGGMRQAGIVAAAGLYALEHHVERLAVDHARAARLADALAAQGWEVLAPETNMVYVTVPDAPAAQASLEAQGVRLLAVSPTRVRMVLHLDVDDAGVERAIAAWGARAAGKS